MKKQLILLFAAISLLVLAQSPQRFPGGVVAKYYQRTGSTADSVLLGNGATKALSAIKTDTTHLSARINLKEDKANKGAANGYAPLGNNAQISDSYIPSNIARMTDINNGTVTAAIGYTPENSDKKGIANGYAPLDASAKISTSYLPAAIFGALNYQGTWAASVGVYPTTVSKGYYWVISTPGILGTTSYKTNDWLTYNGTSWDKVDNQQTLSSVFGRTGAVVATAGDYNTDQVTEGTNKYYTDARARASLSFAAGSGAYNSSTGVITIPTNTNQLTNGAGYIAGIFSGTQGLFIGSGNTIYGNNATQTTLGFMSAADKTKLDGISGASGYIPKFGSSNSLGNSLIYDNGTNVGIGTTSPIANLQIAGTGTTTPAIYAYNYNGAGASRGIQIEAGGNSSDYSANFANRSGSSLLYVRGDGNVGIGTTSPAYTLDVSGTARTGNLSIVNSSNSIVIKAFENNSQTIQASGWLSLQPNSGSVGLGYTSDTNPGVISAKLAVNGSIYASGDIRVSGTITSTGIMYAPNFQTTSDARLKTKIKPIVTKQLPVNYYSFYLKTDTTDLRYGVIAQEVQKVAPELVGKGKDGYLSVKYTDLLVREVAALKEQIKELKEQIKELKDELFLIKSRQDLIEMKQIKYSK